MIKDNKFFINDLKNIVFFGETSVFGDLKNINDQNNLKTFFITSSHQSKKISKKINYKIFDKVDKNFQNYIEKKVDINKTLFISIGSRIIFSKNILEKFFNNNLVNVHPSMLPLGSGAGHFSWKILTNDKIEMQLIHLVNEKIDGGPIIKYEKRIFPNSCKKPIDFEKHFLKNFLVFYSRFLHELINKKKYELKHQPEYLGNYLPKLYTIKNGYINWDLNSIELYSFICAFDDPYQGATTFINGNLNKKIFIKDVFLHGGNLNSHSFMSGLVINKESDWIEVCTKDKNVLLIKKILNKNGKNIIGKIQKGDRLFTPTKYLDEGKSFRAKYTSLGLKKK